MGTKKIVWLLSVLLIAAVWLSFPAPQTPGGLVLVEGGTFVMGTADDGSDEQPIHRVTLDGFYIGKFEVTQGEWQKLMGDTPSFFKGDDHPVDMIDWYAAVKYCNVRSRAEGLTPCYSGSGDDIACDFEADGYRLPTEAEWEYACRGGVQGRGFDFSGSDNVDEVAWYEGNAGGRHHPVGQRKPNELGIYDMSGNIWEWCWDWYGQDYYKSSPAKNPTGPPSGKMRSYRGGGGCGRMEFQRCSGRYKLEASYTHSDMGFRLAKRAKGRVPDGMVRVEGGTFRMGSGDGSLGESPAHKVTLDSFYIGRCEVTQDEWFEVMGNRPSTIFAAKNPVDSVRWPEAVEYCNKRSAKEGYKPCYSGSGDAVACDFEADGYRLPTEAEWEYACRGGAHSRDYTFSGSDDADEVAWHNGNAMHSQTGAVGLKKANELGIYDMTGNAWEWCWDRFDKYYYKKSPACNPRGPSSGVRRVARSGSVYYPAFKNTTRFGILPLHGYAGFGFRVVRRAIR